jgi:hypothetical protein
MKIYSEYFNRHLEEVYKKRKIKSEIWNYQEHCKQDEILSCDLGCK